MDIRALTTCQRPKTRILSIRLKTRISGVWLLQMKNGQNWLTLRNRLWIKRYGKPGSQETSQEVLRIVLLRGFLQILLLL